MLVLMFYNSSRLHVLKSVVRTICIPVINALLMNVHVMYIVSSVSRRGVSILDRLDLEEKYIDLSEENQV